MWMVVKGWGVKLIKPKKVKEVEDLTGKRFGSWLVIKRAEDKTVTDIGYVFVIVELKNQ